MPSRDSELGAGTVHPPGRSAPAVIPVREVPGRAGRVPLGSNPPGEPALPVISGEFLFLMRRKTNLHTAASLHLVRVSQPFPWVQPSPVFIASEGSAFGRVSVPTILLAENRGFVLTAVALKSQVPWQRTQGT